ncbi:DUF1501 domain-containing protein [Nocardia terpenica]|uniref:DUF1501 domain-containing protein n=1 Tax=Nocardia terpenica TaxID=455432 RepID=A0A164KIV4_9NOCA|nr:DUF1501 domain-containing protein [Nocardia terpenica]KZM71440.1 hypothetical protein AWN90_01380 [Nocardia terpenica]NQE90612.1 DUF1501 domain-containing protein [Nocardia terpenica]
MPEVTRRQFLVGSGVLGALGALGAATLTWDELAHRARTTPLPPGAGILVVLTMYGGNDGINTLIPYADNAYHDARPELSYRPEEVLHLDEALGLNPAMKGMAELWRNRQLAIVRGVGYPKPDHSHFRSMDIWQTASPDQPVPTGWIGRWLDATGDDPVRAVNIGSVLPQLAMGAKHTAAALDPATAPLPPDLSAALAGLAAADLRDTTAQGCVCTGYRAEQTVTQTFSALHPAKAAPGGNPLTAQLDLVSRCIKAGVPTRVYSVSLGGFDTHADERHTQERLLGRLDEAMSAFLRDIAAHPRGRDVVLLAYSEFGRRVRANASQGTDHGTAGPVFLAGSSITPGFHGDEPSLTDLDNGDLKTTVDFRDIYHELLHGVLGADPAAILGPGRRDLGLLA